MCRYGCSRFLPVGYDVPFYQVSKALVEANPAGTLFVLEDLKGCRECMIVPYGKSRRPMLVGWAYLDLEGKLAYKAARAGSIVIKVDPAYTSQACPPVRPHRACEP